MINKTSLQHKPGCNLIVSAKTDKHAVLKTLRTTSLSIAFAAASLFVAPFSSVEQAYAALATACSSYARTRSFVNDTAPDTLTFNGGFGVTANVGDIISFQIAVLNTGGDGVFSVTVGGVTQTGISVTAGSTSSVITFTVATAGNQTMSVELTSGTNVNADVSASCSFTTSAAPLKERMEAVFSVEPDRNRLRRRLGGERPADDVQPFSFSAVQNSSSVSSRFSAAFSQVSAYASQENSSSQGSGIAAPQENHRTDVWVEAYLRRYWSDIANEDRDGTLGILYGGVDHVLTDRILIGFLAQVDWLDETTNATSTTIESVGWMAGPYATFRLSDAIYFDIRGAWGQSFNDQTIGTATGGFDTTRWVIAAQLSGDWRHENWRVTPVASLRYGKERSESYTLSNAVQVASSNAISGSLSLGPEIGYTYMSDNGTRIEPFAGLFGIWDFAGPDSISIGGVTSGLDQLRAEAELGISARWQGGAALRASVAYDGLQTDDFEAVSGRLWLNVPLN